MMKKGIGLNPKLAVKTIEIAGELI